MLDSDETIASQTVIPKPWGRPKPSPPRNRRTKVSTAQVGTRRGGTREEQVSTHDLSQGDARSRSGRTVSLPGTRLSASLGGRGYRTSARVRTKR